MDKWEKESLNGKIKEKSLPIKENLKIINLRIKTQY